MNRINLENRKLLCLITKPRNFFAVKQLRSGLDGLQCYLELNLVMGVTGAGRKRHSGSSRVSENAHKKKKEKEDNNGSGLHWFEFMMGKSKYYRSATESNAKINWWVQQWNHHFTWIHNIIIKRFQTFNLRRDQISSSTVTIYFTPKSITIADNNNDPLNPRNLDAVSLS